GLGAEPFLRQRVDEGGGHGVCQGPVALGAYVEGVAVAASLQADELRVLGSRAHVLALVVGRDAHRGGARDLRARHDRLVGVAIADGTAAQQHSCELDEHGEFFHGGPPWTKSVMWSRVVRRDYTRWNRRSSGKRRIHTAATTIVPIPPIRTAATGPNRAASRPDSNSPSWFEVPVVNECAALTRPRMLSGVRICTSECRMTTPSANKPGSSRSRRMKVIPEKSEAGVISSGSCAGCTAWTSPTSAAARRYSAATVA